MTAPKGETSCAVEPEIEFGQGECVFCKLDRASKLTHGACYACEVERDCREHVTEKWTAFAASQGWHEVACVECELGRECSEHEVRP